MAGPARVAVVTDSTASLPPGLAAAHGVEVVPLHVVVDGADHREGVDLSSAQLVAALRRGAAVSTAHPGPDTFARTYAELAARGAEAIVSLHLSGELSGTVDAARLAAARSPVPVQVVDSRTVGMGLGFGAMAAAEAGRDGADLEAVARAGRRRAEGSTVHFAVDSLDRLRRGGRLSPVAAAVGTVLGVRPVLTVVEGALAVVEKARTSARARERVLELALAEAARRDRFALAVHHLGDPALATMLTAQLRAWAPPGLVAVHSSEISAVVGAHVGPGLVAVVVADG